MRSSASAGSENVMRSSASAGSENVMRSTALVLVVRML